MATNYDNPSIYVADLKAYNEGKLIGEWVDLTEFDEGYEVMEKISDLMDGYSKKYHNGMETEYAIHDFENFSRELYSESMGEEDFDIILKTHKISEERDIPAEVLQDVMARYDSASKDIEGFIDDRYRGQFDTESDFAYDYVDMTGGIENLGKDTIDMYFDYGSFGSDYVTNYIDVVDGHYFDSSYKKGGKIQTHDLKKYMKRGGGIYPQSDIAIITQFSFDELISQKFGQNPFLIIGKDVIYPINTENGVEEIVVERFKEYDSAKDVVNRIEKKSMEGKFAKGGKLKSFFSKAKEVGGKAYEKGREVAHYTKEKAKEGMHNASKSNTLGVLDKVKDKGSVISNEDATDIENTKDLVQEHYQFEPTPFVPKKEMGGKVDKYVLPKNLKKKLDKVNQHLNKFGGRSLTEKEAIRFNIDNNAESGFQAGSIAFDISEAPDEYNGLSYHRASTRYYHWIGDALIEISEQMTNVPYDSHNYEIERIIENSPYKKMAKGGQVYEHLDKADSHLREAGSKLWENKNPKSDEYKKAYDDFQDKLTDIYTPREWNELDYAKGGEIQYMDEVYESNRDRQKSFPNKEGIKVGDYVKVVNSTKGGIFSVSKGQRGRVYGMSGGNRPTARFITTNGRNEETLTENLVKISKEEVSKGAGYYAKGGLINKEFLSNQTSDYTNRILQSIADYYGTTKSKIQRELYDDDAEMIYEYIGNDRGLRKLVYDQMESFKYRNNYAKGGNVGGKPQRTDLIAYYIDNHTIDREPPRVDTIECSVYVNHEHQLEAEINECLNNRGIYNSKIKGYKIVGKNPHNFSSKEVSKRPMFNQGGNISESDWERYVSTQKDGSYNMFDSRAIQFANDLGVADSGSLDKGKWSNMMQNYDEYEEKWGLDYSTDYFAKGGRVDEMVNSFKKYGYAKAHIHDDTEDFFERIGIDSDEIGTTSEYGTDIIFYDTNRKNKFNTSWDNYAKGGSTKSMEVEEVMQDHFAKGGKMAYGGNVDIGSYYFKDTDGEYDHYEYKGYSGELDIRAEEDYGDGVDSEGNKMEGYFFLDTDTGYTETFDTEAQARRGLKKYMKEVGYKVVSKKKFYELAGWDINDDYADGGSIGKSITYSATFDLVDADGNNIDNPMPSLQFDVSSDVSYGKARDLAQSTFENGSFFEEGMKAVMTDFWMGEMDADEEDRKRVEVQEEEEREEFVPRVERSGKWDASYSVLCDELATYEMGGEVEDEMIVNYSSWFDRNKYDTDKMIKALESIGAENIYLEQDRGWSNLPEVVVFSGVSKSKAEDKLNEVFNTEWISVGKKDWEKGGDIDSLYAKGGDVKDFSYEEDILPILKESIDDGVDEIDDYENVGDAQGEEVEYKSRSGFIPYTDGGYEKKWFEYISTLNGSGTSLPTEVLDDEMQRQVDYAYETAKKQFIENNEELVEEIGEEKVNYSDLYELEMGEKAEELSEMEMDMGDDSIMMSVKAFYYNPSNSRAENNQHTITLIGDVNLEAPYHRSGNMDDYKEITFTFNSKKELEDKMSENMEHIIDWFGGDGYSDSTREMKIRRMAKGGSMASGGEIDSFSEYQVFYNDEEMIKVFKDKSSEDAYNVSYFGLLENDELPSVIDEVLNNRRKLSKSESEDLYRKLKGKRGIEIRNVVDGKSTDKRGKKIITPSEFRKILKDLGFKVSFKRNSLGVFAIVKDSEGKELPTIFMGEEHRKKWLPVIELKKQYSIEKDYEKVFFAKGGHLTSYGLSFEKVDYDVNVNPNNLEVDVNIKESDSVNHYDLNDTKANWEQHHWGYMVYPKNEKQLYDVLKALRVSVSKKRLADFVKDGSYAKGGSVNMDKEIWEGWRVRDFIEALDIEFQYHPTFKSRNEVKKWAMSSQPYYKKYIPEVVNYYWEKSQDRHPTYDFAKGGSMASGGDIKNLSEESKKAKANAKYYNESYVVYSEDGKAINIAKETWDDLSPKAKEGRELIETHLSSYDKGKKK